MAGGLLGGNNGGKRSRYRPMAEINVTPMVDIMLVLLIIFMVTAPLLTNSVNVDLPKADAAATPQDDKPLQISVDAQGKIYLQDEEVEMGDLTTKLKAISQDNADKKIFVRGDNANSYGRMLEVMGTIYRGGFTKVSLLTNPSGLAAPAPTSNPTAAGVPAAPAARTPAPVARPAARP